MLVFLGIILVVLGLIHFYLWKRLVKDPLPRGRARRIGTVLIIGLAVLIPVTLVGSRTGFLTWLAWPGYMWLALMFYLLVTLAVLEIPRLVLRLAWRPTRTGTARTGTARTDTARTDNARTDNARTDTARTDTARTAVVASGLRNTPQSRTTGTAEPHPGDGPRGPADPGRPGDGPPSEHDPASKPADTPPSPEDNQLTTPGDEDNQLTTKRADAPADRGIERRLLLARGAAIVAGLTAASVTGYGVKTALGPPQLDRLQLPFAKLPRAMDGTRLAVVSDIHLGPLTGPRHAARIVELINSVKADIVCVVGDLVDGSVAELGRFAAPLADIESRYGAYFVTGNHEYYSGYEEWVEEVARLGLRPLRNERVEIEGLDLAGVNDVGGTEFGDGPDLARALGDRDPARPVVLMAHQPVVAREAAPFGVDLQVSGHTHGGQMAPFNLLVRAEQPVVSGLGEVDGVPVYVTNGAGWWGPPVRVGAPPQVSVIELRL